MKIRLHRQKTNTTYKATEKDFEITFEDIEAVSFSESMQLVHRLIETIMTRVLANHHSVRLVLRSPELVEPIQTPFIKKKDLDVRGVLDYVVGILNSNESFHIYPGITLNIVHAAVPMGGRGKKNPVNQHEKDT